MVVHASVGCTDGGKSHYLNLGTLTVLVGSYASFVNNSSLLERRNYFVCVRL